MLRCKWFTLLLLMISGHFEVLSQAKIDSSYLQLFDRDDNIQVFTGFYQNNFAVTAHSYRKTQYELLGNTSAYAGLNLNYKWFSLLVSPNLPGTNIDKKDKNIKSIQLQSYHFWRSWGFELNFSQFRGLLVKDRSKDSFFETFPGVRYTGVNSNIYYFFDHSHYSYLSSMYYSERQLKSAGSSVVMLTPGYQQFKTKLGNNISLPDSLSYNFIVRQPSWVSMALRYGYSYNFVFQKGKWSINPIAFLEAGVLKEMNNQNRQLYPLSGFQFRLNGGYNGANYFFYLNSIYDNTSSYFHKAFLQSGSFNVSLTAGLRFHSFRKKILGLL
ncbi:MAG: DUF4421 domain-containing protein [Terrimonas sp.]|nr:DUF4421 domain-containing protein [Terrimonas sp.]